MRTRGWPEGTHVDHPAQPGHGLPVLRSFYRRPYLMIAIAAGVICYFLSAPIAPRVVTRILIGWNGGVLVSLGLTLGFVWRADIEKIKRRAIALNEGGRLILVLTILAAVVSIVALVEELTEAKGQPGGGLRIALAGMTVVLSWLFVQFVFTMHYAHVYYLAKKNGKPQGGLDFGPQGEPDYWDFLHFAIVLGATSQTADVMFTSREMRRVGTLHTLVAFGFNTAILATMINLAASLF